MTTKMMIWPCLMEQFPRRPLKRPISSPSAGGKWTNGGFLQSHLRQLMGFLFYSKWPLLENYRKYDCLNLKFRFLLEWTLRRQFTLGCVLLRVTWRRRPIRNPTASVISPVIVDQAMMSLPVHLSMMVSVHWPSYLGLSRNEAEFFFPVSLIA